jgi:F-type H+-transporting ATPase subunit delta
MSVRLSRQKLSRYYAKSLLGGTDKKKIAMQLAAYLIESGRTKELQMIISDIEYQMSLNGVVVANVTSAHNLDDIAKTALIDFVHKHTDAQHIHLKEYIDPTVLGGVKLKFTGAELDTTIARRLTTLKANYKR